MRPSTHEQQFDMVRSVNSSSSKFEFGCFGLDVSDTAWSAISCKTVWEFLRLHVAIALQTENQFILQNFTKS